MCASTVILAHGSESLQGIWINASLVEQTGTGGCRVASLLNAGEGLAGSTMITCCCIFPPVTGCKNNQVIAIVCCGGYEGAPPLCWTYWSSHTWVSVFSDEQAEAKNTFLPKRHIMITLQKSAVLLHHDAARSELN